MIARACAVAILCSILAFLLDRMGFKSKGLFSSLCALVILSSLFDPLSNMFSKFTDLSKLAGITDAATCALRVVGLGYTFGLTADLCGGLGEQGLSSVILLVGRVQILLLVCPYFEKIIDVGLELIG